MSEAAEALLTPETDVLSTAVPPEQARWDKVTALLTERAVYEPGFEPLLRAWIGSAPLPWAALEERQATALRHYGRRLVPLVVTSLLGLLCLADATARPLGIVLLIAAGTLFLLRRHPAMKDKQAAETQVADWFFRPLGLSWRATPDAVDLALFYDLGLLATPSDQDWSDELRGRILDLPVTSRRVRVWEGHGKRRRCSFEGLLVSTTLPLPPAPRPLRIQTRGGWRDLLSSLTSLGMPTVEAGRSFAETFEVSSVAPSDDEDEVPPALRSSLLDLAAIAGGAFRVGLFDSDLLLALQQETLLPTGRLTSYFASARFDAALAVEGCLRRYDELRTLIETLHPGSGEG